MCLDVEYITLLSKYIPPRFGNGNQNGQQAFFIGPGK